MEKAPIVVALDGMSRADALALARALAPHVWGFKVNDLLVQEGVSIVEELSALGNVFADPKLHDIPNTVANGVRRLSSAGASLITVHASGGVAMLKAAVEAAGEAGILAITALTSLTSSDTNSIYSRQVGDCVRDLAALAAQAGAAGVVCSPNELPIFSKHPELQGLKRVVPGIRPAWHSGTDDQARTDTPRQALQLGAWLLVIGRPITSDKDPLAAVQRILAEISAT